MPGWASILLRAGALLTIVLLAVRTFKRRIEVIAFCAFSMGVFFISTKVLHNNYFVWWLPLVGVTLARAQVPMRTEMKPAQ